MYTIKKDTWPLICIMYSIFHVLWQEKRWRSFQKFCVWLSCNNKIQDNNTTHIPECLHMSSDQYNHQHCPHTFPICRCSSIFILAQIWQWQQCWNHLPLQIAYPENVIPHDQTTCHHMGWDLESRVDVPKPPRTNLEPDFAHHDGDEVLHCPGAKWHHVQAVLVVYSEHPASPHLARVRSNMGHWLS